MSLIEYVDFTLDGVNIRTTYGIYRTSDSASGYDRDGLPKMDVLQKDNTTGNGLYWFGNLRKELEIKIPIAFDNLYREDWEKFMAFLNKNDYFELIFCEQPYKKYYVRLSGAPEISFIPHDSDYDQPITSKTIFKGKGSIQFTCDDGYAVCPNKNPSAYSSLPNYNDFIGESGLIDLTGYNTIIDNTSSVTGQYYINLYNGGKLPSDYRLTLYFRATMDKNVMYPIKIVSCDIDINVYEKNNNQTILLTHYDLNGMDIGEYVSSADPEEDYCYFLGSLSIDSKTHCIGNYNFSELFPSFNTAIPNIKPLPTGYGQITITGLVTYKYTGQNIEHQVYCVWTPMTNIDPISYNYKYF